MEFVSRFASVFVRSQSIESLETLSEAVGHDKRFQVSAQLHVVMIAMVFDGGFLDCSIHALDLPVGPRMVWICQAVIDAMAAADVVEGVSAKQCRWTSAIPRQVGELDAVVGEYSVDPVGNYGRL